MTPFLGSISGACAVGNKSEDVPCGAIYVPCVINLLACQVKATVGDSGLCCCCCCFCVKSFERQVNPLLVDVLYWLTNNLLP